MASRIQIDVLAHNKVEIVVEKQDKEWCDHKAFYYVVHVPVVKYIRKPSFYLLWDFCRYVEDKSPTTNEMNMKFKILPKTKHNDYILLLEVIDLYCHQELSFGEWKTKQEARDFMNELVSRSLASSTQENS